MTKKELIEVLKTSGLNPSSALSKENLIILAENNGLIKDGLWVHDPDNEPAPAPKPEPAPAPAPKVEPEPAPAPKVEPEPAPAPAPKPEPTPAPAPEPAPAPAGETPDSFNDLFEKIKGAEGKKIETGGAKTPLISVERKKRKKAESSPDSFRLEGYVLLLVVDTVFPFSLAWLNNIFSKQVKVQATDIMLKEKDFTKLEPLADQAADYLAIHVNPVVGFLLVSGFIYTNNLIQARIVIEAQLKTK